MSCLPRPLLTSSGRRSGSCGSTRRRRRSSRTCALAKTLLCIPNSNAAPERTFSMVRNFFADQHADMHNEALSALLKCQLNTDDDCTQFAPSERLLQLARACCSWPAQHAHLTMNCAPAQQGSACNCCVCCDFENVNFGMHLYSMFYVYDYFYHEQPFLFTCIYNLLFLVLSFGLFQWQFGI